MVMVQAYQTPSRFVFTAEKAALAEPDEGVPEDAPEDLIKAILAAKKKQD